MSAISVERLRELLSYDPDSGLVRWNVSRGKAAAGSIAGCPDHRGYLVVGIDKKRYYLHRIAVALVTGAMPTDLVDHRDGNRSNNRWGNLREASHALNMQNQRKASKNSSTGALGVRRFGPNFRAAICVDGRQIHLGTFKTQEIASAIYLEAKRRLHAGCTL